MGFFDWKEEYMVHIDVIDRQHRKLVSLVDELYNAMRSGKGKEVSGPILQSLIDYTRDHFATEERLMQVNNYPGYIAHLREHTDLTSKVIVYQKKSEEGTSVVIDLGGFLKDWLVTHIAGSDKKYAPYLKNKGVS